MTDNQHKEPEGQFTKPRGRLKIFLGAVAGVGKTYKMLAEAHRRSSRGQDIAIGLVETHGRPATAELVKGLEQIPLKRLEYRGSTFHELDTAAVIKRHPQWVIIDELAHTNIPGTVHAKRWQSIEEIRAAGINVLTTLNIQHLESLNDVVYEITGVRVRETVPDSIVDDADEIELTDLTPEAVINRLKRGDIYKGEKIEQALQNFFRKGNIVALRELALRQTTEEVDEDLQEYMEAHKMARGKAAREHVVVCITPQNRANKLIRRGYRIARGMQGNFACIYVRVPRVKISKKEEESLNQAKELLHNFDKNLVELEGDSVSEEIIKYVNEVGATTLVMGQSARSRLQEILYGSIISRIMRETKNVDIIVVSDLKDDRDAA